MKQHSQIRIDLNLAVTSIYERNTKVMHDIAFAKIPSAQWSESDLQQYANKPRPENNKLARQINRILGQYQKLDINAKVVKGSHDATEDNAKLLEGRWRNDFNMTQGIEALHNAADEAFFGGFGAFKIVCEYEDDDQQDPDCQQLAIQPIYSAASSVFFDSGALKKNKSDALQGWHLLRASREKLNDKYSDNVVSLGEQIDFFDYDFDINRDVYVAHYYEVIEETEYCYDFGFMTLKKRKKTFYDNFGHKMDKGHAQTIIDSNPHEVNKRIYRYVEYALMDGNRFLEPPRKTPFKRVPLIPQYGYHAIINGIEYFIGEVARQRDNQRFLNMSFSAMMQILAENQIEKPEYAPEQINRYQQMHERMNVDDYAYLLSDPIRDVDGKITHLGPVGMHTPPQIGTGLTSVIEFLNNNIDEQGSTGQTSVSSNVASDTIEQVNQRADDSYQKLFQNALEAIRNACMVWLDAAKVIYFSKPRDLRIQNQDQSFSEIQTMQMGYDDSKGKVSFCILDGRGKYEVIIKTNESYLSMKEAMRRENLETLQYIDTNSELGQMALMNVILSGSSDLDANVKKLAKVKQFEILLNNGIMPEIENQAEQELLQKVITKLQQQAQQPDPNVILAEAEQTKADAEQADSKVRAYDAETRRMKLGLDAAKIHADIGKIRAETRAQNIESLQPKPAANQQ